MEDEMRILGIDPGLQVCGYACLEMEADKEKLIEAGVIRTEKGPAIEIKLNRIAEDTRSLLENFKPDVVAVEELRPPENSNIDGTRKRCYTAEVRTGGN
jgi:crossover junction endodeoxyribonuclease RuvC